MIVPRALAFTVGVSMVLGSLASVRAQVCPSTTMKIVAPDGFPGNSFGAAVAISGDLAVIGAPSTDDYGSDPGSVYVFSRSGGVWTRQAKLAGDGVAGDQFGFSVAIDGDTIVVGSPFNSSRGFHSGTVYVFVRSGSSWNLEAKLDGGGSGGNHLGFSTAISGQRVAIGDLGGHVWVYLKTGGYWLEEAYLTTGIFADLFGVSVSVSGDTVAVGAPAAGAGAAYVFERGVGTWSLAARLDSPLGGSSAFFGSSVSLSEDRLVVGAPRENLFGADAGTAWVFVRSGAGFGLEARLDTTDRRAGDRFGQSVAISGDSIVVGAPSKTGASTHSGNAYVFTRATTWNQQTAFNAPDDTMDGLVGRSVAVSGDAAIAGASRHGGSLSDGSGAAYVLPCVAPGSKLTRFASGDFAKFGASVDVSGDSIVTGAPQRAVDSQPNVGFASVCVPDGDAWVQQAELVPHDAAPGSLYGWRTAIDGDTAAVSGLGAEFGGINAGAVYVFVRAGTTWTEQAKLGAFDGVVGDDFGYSMDLSSDTLVVGAFLDDDGGSDAGSAYVYVRSGSTWSLQQKIVPGDLAANQWFGYSVAISGDTIVVGAPASAVEREGYGSVYVYERSGGVWTQHGEFNEIVPRIADAFGISVAISDDTIAVGALTDEDAGQQAGSATVFVRSSGVWVREWRLLASDSQEYAYFGSSVAVSADLVAVAAPERESRRGATYLFTRFDGGGWVQRQIVLAGDAVNDDHYGEALALGDSFLGVGAPEKEGYAGAVYAYRLDKTPPVITCPADITVRADEADGTNVLFKVSATDDVDPGPVVSCYPESGSLFSPGSTAVGCTARDSMGRSSSCSFVVNVLPNGIFFRRGNVNAGVGAIADVLFVNGSAGDPLERKILLSTTDPLEIRVERPPSKTSGTSRFVMYLWLSAPTDSTVLALPGGIGPICMPTPLDRGSLPQPRLIANSIGRASQLGAEKWPGPRTRPAPTTLASVEHIGQPLTMFLQGIIYDSASLQGTVAVTNGVLVIVGP